MKIPYLVYVAFVLCFASITLCAPPLPDHLWNAEEGIRYLWSQVQVDNFITVLPNRFKDVNEEWGRYLEGDGRRKINEHL